MHYNIKYNERWWPLKSNRDARRAGVRVSEVNDERRRQVVRISRYWTRGAVLFNDHSGELAAVTRVRRDGQRIRDVVTERDTNAKSAVELNARRHLNRRLSARTRGKYFIIASSHLYSQMTQTREWEWTAHEEELTSTSIWDVGVNCTNFVKRRQKSKLSHAYTIDKEKRTVRVPVMDSCVLLSANLEFDVVLPTICVGQEKLSAATQRNNLKWIAIMRIRNSH